MTSHQFAKKLLEGPDLPIAVPKVVEYCDDEEDNTANPVACVTNGIGPEGDSIKCIIISYKE